MQCSAVQLRETFAYLCVAALLYVWVAQLQLHWGHLAGGAGVAHPEGHAVSASKGLEAFLGATLPAGHNNIHILTFEAAGW
jgi:hypothetical protein